MDRRSFIRLLGAGLVAPIIEPQVRYILPPVGGWVTPVSVLNFTGGSVDSMGFPVPAFISYYEYLVREGITSNINVYERDVRPRYLDLRADNAFKPLIDLTPKHKQRSR